MPHRPVRITDEAQEGDGMTESRQRVNRTAGEQLLPGENSPSPAEPVA